MIAALKQWHLVDGDILFSVMLSSLPLLRPPHLFLWRIHAIDTFSCASRTYGLFTRAFELLRSYTRVRLVRLRPCSSKRHTALVASSTALDLCHHCCADSHESVGTDGEVCLAEGGTVDFRYHKSVREISVYTYMHNAPYQRFQGAARCLLAHHR